MKIYIVGAGPGEARFLTDEARRAVAGADRVIATPRLAERFAGLNPETRGVSIAGLAEAVLAARGSCRSVAVLVSGDPGFFSAARKLLEEFQGLETECLCGLSSLQYFCSRLGLGYEGMKLISLHGRGGSIVPHVCYNPEVFALTGGEIKAHTAIAALVRAGLGAARVSVGENLGASGAGARERIVSGTARELLAERFADLACLIVRNENFANRHESVRDEEFIRGEAPMTKRAVRAVAVAALNVRPGDTVLDVGAGTGSVAVEMARKAYAGEVYAIERNAAALALLERNREKFGAFNITAVPGHAPEALADLPPADKAFIGGSGGGLGVIIQALAGRNPAVDVVVTAITLETLHEAVAAFAALGREPEICCLNAATARKAGNYHMMRAENPVYIINGKNHES